MPYIDPYPAAACACADVTCSQHGCKRLRDRNRADPDPYRVGWPPATTVALPPQPKGCICPPTSEKTCQRKDCGRK